MRLPIEVDGEIGQFELELAISPNGASPGLRIILLRGRAFWRLCMDNAEHPNSFNRPADLPPMTVGPHQHSWPDNRRFGNPTSLPQKLRNARILPATIKSNDDAFAWFLGQVNILYPRWDMPEWPKKTLLF